MQLILIFLMLDILVIGTNISLPLLFRPCHISECLNANKLLPSVDNSKTGKLAPGTVNNNKDLDVEMKKDEASFFGSFFSGSKTGAAAKKKGVAAMDTVCFSLIYICSTITSFF